LPRIHNDVRPVSPEKFQQTLPIRGLWIHKETRYEDELIPIIVDMDDTPEDQHFFLRLKSILLERFEQIAVYIVSYPVDIL